MMTFCVRMRFREGVSIVSAFYRQSFSLLGKSEAGYLKLLYQRTWNNWHDTSTTLNVRGFLSSFYVEPLPVEKRVVMRYAEPLMVPKRRLECRSVLCCYSYLVTNRFSGSPDVLFPRCWGSICREPWARVCEEHRNAGSARTSTKRSWNR